MGYEQPFEEKGDLTGHMSVTFRDDHSLQEYCRKHVANYDAERLEAFAIRLLLGENLYITLYAVDKAKSTHGDEELPVKKFKLPISFLNEVPSILKEANLTLTTGTHPLENMRILNK